MKRIVIGILAHVDAGKTTLSEAVLYLAGALKKLGRVDHRDAFLDTFEIERERGITVFSKQAEFSLENTEVTLLDTPGHVDFSAEAERVLQVLDYAVLVVSGTDGVQSHTLTLWELFKYYHIPVIIFVNKMDLPGAEKGKLMSELKGRLSDGCIDISPGLKDESVKENLAMFDDVLLERVLENGEVTANDVAKLSAKREVFPCFFGSALRLEGVSELLEALDVYTMQPDYGLEFGAKVFKVSRDAQGNRLSYMKITGGTLKVRDLLRGAEDGGWQEKVSQLRIYSGGKFKTTEEAYPGMICAAMGLMHTRPGTSIGSAAVSMEPVLEPVLTYKLLLPEGCDANKMLQNMRCLEEEDPQLKVTWQAETGTIQVLLMGEIQLEILTRLIEERFGVKVRFDEGSTVYKETIAAPVLGIGHFEPLRHYAEVQLLLEPGERGSGLRFSTACSLDVLDLNWQRLILTHLAEKRHKGVLTGAQVTDVTITLITGKAHVKHTEGGDFREATYRAVRNGLMQAENQLLEPYYRFVLEVPENLVGRAMNDIQRLEGSFEPPETENGFSILKGAAPVSTMRGYRTEVAAYTKGEGRLSCVPDGYKECHNAKEVIEASGYDPERDTENPPDSVFCSHGAGVIVKWDEVFDRAHMDSGLRIERAGAEQGASKGKKKQPVQDSEAEIRAIFERTYGPVKNRGFEAFKQSRRKSAVLEQLYVTRVREDDYLLVDGYNIIFAWDELNKLASVDIESAREKLVNVLSNYQSIRKCHLILVFDAYKVKGGVRSIEKRHGLDIVYTREAETADMYIEQASYDLSKKHRVRVATSDGMEQLIILGHGSERLSAKELKWEVDQADMHLRDVLSQLGANN